MYATFTMGAGFAFYLPAGDTAKAQDIFDHAGFASWDAGVVEKGPKQVIIEPKGIVYAAETLQIR